MSAMALDVRPFSHGLETAVSLDLVAGENHPRGRGFRVLSRMARTTAAEEGYSPRHRLDAETDSIF